MWSQQDPNTLNWGWLDEWRLEYAGIILYAFSRIASYSYLVLSSALSLYIYVCVCVIMYIYMCVCTCRNIRNIYIYTCICVCRYMCVMPAKWPHHLRKICSSSLCKPFQMDSCLQRKGPMWQALWMLGPGNHGSMAMLVSGDGTSSAMLRQNQLWISWKVPDILL